MPDESTKPEHVKFLEAMMAKYRDSPPGTNIMLFVDNKPNGQFWIEASQDNLIWGFGVIEMAKVKLIEHWAAVSQAREEQQRQESMTMAGMPKGKVN